MLEPFSWQRIMLALRFSCFCFAALLAQENKHQHDIVTAAAWLQSNACRSSSPSMIPLEMESSVKKKWPLCLGFFDVVFWLLAFQNLKGLASCRHFNPNCWNYNWLFWSSSTFQNRVVQVFEQIGIKKSKAEAMFKACDSDQDGVINCHEFISWLTKQRLKITLEQHQDAWTQKRIKKMRVSWGKVHTLFNPHHGIDIYTMFTQLFLHVCKYVGY